MKLSREEQELHNFLKTEPQYELNNTKGKTQMIISKENQNRWKALDEIIEKESDGNKKDRLRLVKEYFTNPKFNKYISDLIWEINNKKPTN